jgi:two-component system chemotaxis sensor kinase CheA
MPCERRFAPHSGRFFPFAPLFLATSQRLNLITTELQEGVMKTRMQPIGTVWSKFPRVVRDLALACGKQVRVEMDGKDTELDKTIIEAIKDPLTHMVRNSVDHGIESPEVRLAAGKPAAGCLSLKAFHEGGQVNIEIADDGAGINFERVKQKALERGLITPEQAACMSDREAANLIFLPGFSTAEMVTNVSGRGVGMDVVKTNLEKIGGTVDLQSKSGQGSTFKVKIPLTLAIIPALTITSGGDRYAIPQVNLLELVRLERGLAAPASR